MDFSARGSDNSVYFRPTVFEIVQHVIINKPYENRTFQPIVEGSNINKVCNKLLSETTPEILMKVKDFVAGNLTEEMLGLESTSAYQYLAAVKIVDLGNDPSKSVKSTYKIREMILSCSKTEANGRSQINMMNAFSLPPATKEYDILIANEIDNNHPLVKNAVTAAERNAYLTGIYTYGQREAEIIPEMVPIIEDLVRDRSQAMLKINAFLPQETSVIYKGPSGAGKSFAIGKFTEENLKGIDADVAVQSADNIKNDLRRRTRNIFNTQQAHLLGFSILKMLSEVMKKTYPKLSTIQEGWYNSTFALDALFKDIKAAGLKLDVHDFDGSFEVICLRVLNRYRFKDSAKPALNEIEQAYKSTRETRAILLKSLRETDTYRFSYVHSNGVTDDKMQATAVVSDPDAVNRETTTTKALVITKEHAQFYGDYLNAFLGMTIEEAFEKVRLM